MPSGKMVAAIYNVWDGDELLRGSIEQIRNQVDQVIVVYQTISNFGERYNPQLPDDLIDRKIHYAPIVSKGGQWNEIAKRDLGLSCAKIKGCRHFILMDCDEYYESEIFEQYKNLVIEKNVDGSACRLYTYYKEPTIRLTPIENYYVPFIHKIYDSSVVRFDLRYPVFADPTRRTNHYKNFHVIDEPIMHHYSWVRKDISRKIRNSSARLKHLEGTFEYFDQTGVMTPYLGFNAERVEDRFNIHL